ncbi:MAG: hypothetical protein JWP37_2632 [Mucilaginibacter sp.]|nr:hypothetical protein [Mucilaginibacter sp.]
MRKLLFVIFILITNIAFAQKDTIGLNIPISNGKVIYERVFKTPGKSKSELYNNAQTWFIEHYNGARNIEINDTTMGRLVGRGKEIVNFKGPLGVLMPFDNRLTIQIDCKDSVYRCRIFNMRLSYPKTTTTDDIDTNPEEMVSILTGKSGVLNKNQARRMLESLNITINDTMLSLYKNMTEKDDF